MLPPIPVDFRQAPGYRSDSIMPAFSNAELVALEREAEREADKRREQVISNLSSHIRRCFEDAKAAKSHIEAEMIAALNQRAGRYEPDVLAEIRKFGGSELFVRLTEQKCVGAGSWIRDVLSLDRPWGLDPTAVPDLSPGESAAIADIINRAALDAAQRQIAESGTVPDPEAVKAQIAQATEKAKADAMLAREKAARARADKMAKTIEDYLDESAFKAVMANAIDLDLTTFGTAILKGPVPRTRRRLAWEQKDGQWTPVEKEEVYPEVERVSPLDLYPSGDATSVEDADYLIEIYKLRRSDLRSFRGIDGYNDREIDDILKEHGTTGHREAEHVDQAVAAASSKSGSAYLPGSNTLDALIFFGEVQGQLLIDWGVKSVEPLAEYSIEAWMIDSHVFRVDIKEPHEAFRPYHKAVYRARPGSFWGIGIPLTIDYLQKMCNAAARALGNNMAIASGPQVGVDLEQMPPGEDGKKMWPWKVWRFNTAKYGQSSVPPLHFFQPDMHAAELMAIYEKFAALADEISGIPRYIQGDSNVGGAGRTASGLSMLMGAASKTVKAIVSNIDMGIIEPLISAMFRYAMLYHPDRSIKGDAKVVAKGSTALIVREQAQVRRNEFLQVTNNPTDLAIMGEARRAELLRSTAETLSLDPDQIAPTREEIEKRQQARELAQQQLAQQQLMAQGQPAATAPRALGPDGAPASGQDFNLFAGGR
ncbi:MAG: hypothetical protein IPL51_10205 [Candidatus Competibacteraceae bacterium]|nr:hypothetical protein [Candidatus Competibacteraceae bacterium]